MEDLKEVKKALEVLKSTRTPEECKQVANKSIGGYKLKIATLKDELIGVATSQSWNEQKAQELIKEISFNYYLLELLEEFKTGLLK